MGAAFTESEKPELSLIMDELEAGEAAVELDDKEPQEVLAWAIDRFGNELAICCSFQADGCALIDMAHKIDPRIRVFTIDTGRMPQETYDVIDKYRDPLRHQRRNLHARYRRRPADGYQARQQSFLSTTSTCDCYAARCARCCRCAAR